MTALPQGNGDALACAVVAPHAWSDLAPEWRSLWRSCSWATPFQHPAWVLAWLDVFVPIEVRMITFRRDGRLVGIAPLCRENNDAEGTLKLAGAGVSDYLDMTASDHERPAVVEALRRWLACQSDVETVTFTDLRGGSPLVDARPPRGFDARRGAQTLCPQMRLATDVHARLLAGSRSFSNATRRAAIHGLKVREATPATLAADLTVLMQLHAARQRTQDHADGSFGDMAVRVFHRFAAAELLAEGNAVLYVLERGGVPLGALYALRDHRRVYTYSQGFNPAAKAYSPGTVLILHTIRDAVATGRTALDFLRGNERYKYGYGARDVPTFSRSWTRRARA